MLILSGRSVPLPHHKVEALRQLVAQELRCGHTEPSLSRWNTPVLVIKKSCGADRLFHDSRAVHAQVVPFGAVQQGGRFCRPYPKVGPR